MAALLLLAALALVGMPVDEICIASTGGVVRALSLPLAAGLETVHLLVQLDHVPTTLEQEELGAARIRLQEYLPDLAWIARLSGGFAGVWAFFRSGLILRTLQQLRP